MQAFLLSWSAACITAAYITCVTAACDLSRTCQYLCCLGSDVSLAFSRDKSLLPSVETLQTTFEETRGRSGYIYYVYSLCSASLWDERFGVCAVVLKYTHKTVITKRGENELNK